MSTCVKQTSGSRAQLGRTGKAKCCRTGCSIWRTAVPKPIWWWSPSLHQQGKLNRRWQKDGAGRYESLPPLSWLLAQLPPLPDALGIADAADLYSVLSALHAKRRNPQPAACAEQGFYYFWADAPPAANGTSVEEIGPGSSARREPVVPVGSKHQHLTMERLVSLFKLNAQGAPVPHLLLAIADDDGSVSFMRCFAHVQPPFEGPGALPEVGQGQGAGLGVQTLDSDED